MINHAGKLLKSRGLKLVKNAGKVLLTLNGNLYHLFKNYHLKLHLTAFSSQQNRKFYTTI